MDAIYQNHQRHEENEWLKSKHTNKIEAKTAAKIAACKDILGRIDGQSYYTM